MAGIDVGMQKRDGNGFDTLAFEVEYGLPNLFVVERRFYLAPNGQALADFKPTATRDQGRRALPKNIVDAGTPQAADFQFVPKAGGGNQTGPCALFFQDGVGGDGRAVDEARNGALRVLALGIGNAAPNVRANRIGQGQNFIGQELAVGSGNDDIGEGSANVKGNAQAGGSRHAGLCGAQRKEKRVRAGLRH